MKKLIIFLMLILFTGCSDGQVYKKDYLRSVSVDGDNIILTFFNDDMIQLNSDIEKAKQKAEEITGHEIFTGHTELIVIGNCDKIDTLSFFLKKWKVSPDCTVISGDGNILKEKDTEDITGSVKILEKENKIEKSDIVSTLSRLINRCVLKPT